MNVGEEKVLEMSVVFQFENCLSNLLSKMRKFRGYKTILRFSRGCEKSNLV
jgi:hypothetical protein